jgi:fructokinase
MCQSKKYQKRNLMKKYTIAGIGELLWDVLPDKEVIGGAPVNFAYHAAAIGAQGIPISTIGHDDRGKRALAELQERGLNTAAISLSEDYTTGYVTAAIDEQGAATYSFPGDVAWDHLQINDYAKTVQSKLDAICFGSLAQRSEESRLAIHTFLDGLNPDTVKVFDINLRQNFYSKEIIEASLRRTDILKLNDEELPVLAKLLGLKKTYGEWLTLLINTYDLKMAILSKGRNGSILMTPDDSSEHPGIATEVTDTIGAGDSFTAAATIGYLQEMTLDDINEKANRLAAYVCSQQGAMPLLPESLKI